MDNTPHELNYTENTPGFPIELNFRNLSNNCLVVGGGKVATRKVTALCNAGAKVTVISPKLTKELQEFALHDEIHWSQRNYSYGDVRGYLIVFACTSDSHINEKIAEECQELEILVNVATSQKASSFTLPASFSRGDLTISVSTKGASPALSAQIIRDLKNIYGPEWEKFLLFLRISREMIMSQVVDEEWRKQLFHELAKDREVFTLVCNTEEIELVSLCERIVTEKIGGQ